MIYSSEQAGHNAVDDDPEQRDQPLDLPRVQSGRNQPLIAREVTEGKLWKVKHKQLKP